MTHVRKIKAGGVNTTWQNFVGEVGTLFYDHTLGNLRLSDGHTPGGVAPTIYATTATFAQSFNTSTLIAQAVSANTATIAQSVVGGIGVASLTVGTGTFISTTTGAVTIWVNTASTFNTATLVAIAVTSTFAQSFNTATLVAIAVTSTFAQSFNTATLVAIAVTSTFAQSFNTSTLVNSAVYANTASGNFTVPGNLNVNGGTIYNNGYALTTATSFNTATLVSLAVTSTFAQSFNTATLVSLAVTSTFAQSFNTATLVNTAVNATKLTNGSNSINIDSSGHLLPNNNLSQDLGSTSSQWRSLYVGTNTIFIGGTAVSVGPSGSLSVGGSVAVNNFTGTSVTGSINTSTGVVTLAFNTNTLVSSAVTSTYSTTATSIINQSTATIKSSTYNWAFGTNGSLTFPDATVQTTAYTGSGTTSNTGTTSTFIISNTSTSNSTNTGALQVVGGVGVGGNAFVGGSFTATGVIYQGAWAVSTASNVLTSPYSGIFTSTNTTAATSTSTGALQVYGGVGIGENLYVGGIVTATTFIGSANLGTTSTTASALGYLGMPQLSTASSYTLVAGDQGRHIYITATGQTITIPANTVVAFPIGSTVAFIAGPSATTVSIAITTDTMYLGGAGTAGTRTLAAYGMATAVKVAATTWFINGTGLT